MINSSTEELVSRYRESEHKYTRHFQETGNKLWSCANNTVKQQKTSISHSVTPENSR